MAVCGGLLASTASAFATSRGWFWQWTCLPQVFFVGFLDGCDSMRLHCATGIAPNLARIEHHLADSLMLVTALNTHIGYENAAKIAKKAHADGSSLKEAAVSLGLLTAAQYDEWVVPVEMTRPLAP